MQIRTSGIQALWANIRMQQTGSLLTVTEGLTKYHTLRACLCVCVCVCVYLTDDAAVPALQGRGGAGDGAVGTAVSVPRVHWGARGQRGAGATSRGRRCAAGQTGARTDPLGHQDTL